MQDREAADQKILNHVGQKLRQAREGHKDEAMRSIYGVAKASGVERHAIKRMEEAVHDGRVTTLVKVARALGVDASKLLPK